MKRSIALAVFVFTAILLIGCIVRTYPVVRDRVDQNISGNQGYMAGTTPQASQTENRPAQRTTYTTEIELKNPFKSQKSTNASAPIEEKTKNTSTEETTENQKPAKTTQETTALPLETKTPTKEPQSQVQKVDIYIVKPGDTLQKIASKGEVYADGKKWTKIYNANKDALKNPNKIYAGQKLKIPRD